MRRVVRVLSVVVAGAALALAGPSPAGARDGTGGDDTGDGYEVGVEVVLTGDGAPGDGGSYTVSIPPVCWWERLDGRMLSDGSSVDAGDPEAVLAWYEETYPELNGSFSFARGMFPDREVFENAIAQEAAGTDLTWYQVRAGDAGSVDDMMKCAQGSNYGGVNGEIPIIYWPWVDGEPPAPAVDPETLAIEARDVMVIDEPEVDRNPRLAGTADGATFVNVNTWFWVVDPEMVGGDGGTRTIRADVVGANVWAEVTATTDGLSIASPNGSRQCDPEVAQQAWTSGAADSDGCTVQFTRASVAYPGGYPVTAATEWSASWEGQEEDGTAVGGDLDPLRRESTVNVPVAEVQTVVKRAR